MCSTESTGAFAVLDIGVRNNLSCTISCVLQLQSAIAAAMIRGSQHPIEVCTRRPIMDCRTVMIDGLSLSSFLVHRAFDIMLLLTF